MAVSFTFDVDAEAGPLGRSSDYRRRLTTLSEARFGLVRGLPRLLALLDRHGISATFYVPGLTAERDPDAIRALVEAGHEVAHHGYLHLRPDQIEPARQREEIERGIAALEASVGVSPVGYRSPSWELTPESLALLVEYRFAYDSSCMGDDRPYLEEAGGKSVVELPVHWSLDDWPFFGWTTEAGGVLADPATLLAIWLAEFESALDERRLVTYTLHPEVIGRAHRLTALDRLIEAMREQANVWFPRHDQIAALIREHSPLREAPSTPSAH